MIPWGGADPARVTQGARFYALSRTSPTTARKQLRPSAFYEFEGFIGMEEERNCAVLRPQPGPGDGPVGTDTSVCLSLHLA